jgi:hypothetical protein
MDRTGAPRSGSIHGEKRVLIEGIRLALDEFEKATDPPDDLQDRLQRALSILRPTTERQQAKEVERLVKDASGPLGIVLAVMEETNQVDALLHQLSRRGHHGLAVGLDRRRDRLLAICEAKAKTRRGRKSSKMAVPGDGPTGEEQRPAWEGMLERLLAEMKLPASRRTRLRESW